MTEDNLKPCPFCGSSNLKVDFIDYGQPRDEHGRATGDKTFTLCVNCYDCGISGPEILDNDKAIAAWNNRPLEPPQ